MAGICIALLILGIAVGSVYVPPVDIFSIIRHKVFGLFGVETALPEHIRPSVVAIVWNLRLPRALLAFIAGGALSASGSVMQSVLRNPLASSYTLGVSSGASLGACIVILYGVTMVMKNGEIQACGKTNEVITDSLLKNVYEIDVAQYMRDSLKRWEGLGK